MKAFLTFFLFPLFLFTFNLNKANAQELSFLNITGKDTVEATASLLNFPNAPCPNLDQCGFGAPPNLSPGINPLDQLTFLSCVAGDDFFNCQNKGQGAIQLNVTSAGPTPAQSPGFRIQWWVTARAYMDNGECDCFTIAEAKAQVISVDITFQVNQLPPNTTFDLPTLFSQYQTIGAESEAAMEDLASANTLVEIQVTGQNSKKLFNKANTTNTLGYKQIGVKNKAGTIKVKNGDIITLTLNISTHALIRPLPDTPGIEEDDSFAESFGFLELGIFNDCEEEMYYSIDIGSDMEASHSKLDGTGNLDPADIYGETSPGAPFEKDDKTIFGIDKYPDPSISSTFAPLCQGDPLNITKFMDFDGLDVIDLNITPLLPATNSIEYFPSYQLIHTPDYLYYSYDDDGATHYADLSCSIPPQGYGFGTIGGADEVVGSYWYSSNQSTGSSISPIYIASEESINPNLGLPPDNGLQYNDDLDALDYLPLTNSLINPYYYYFSVDSEACGQYGPNTLKPGIIYRTLPGSGIEESILPDIHLGLSHPDEIDIDAFEFCWLWDATANRYGLALLFSVDVDDILTAGFESSNLDPNKIYASFLNGNYFPFSQILGYNQSDIDALAISCEAPQPLIIANKQPLKNTFEYWEVFPNPSSGKVQLVFSLDKPANVQLMVYSIFGEKVHQSPVQYKNIGDHTIDYQFSDDLPSGTYLIRMQDGNRVWQRKLVLVK